MRKADFRHVPVLPERGWDIEGWEQCVYFWLCGELDQFRETYNRAIALVAISWNRQL